MTRILSAAVLIVLVGGTIWWLPSWATLAMAAVGAALAGSELAGLAGHVDAVVSKVLVASSSAMFCVALAAPAVMPIGVGSDAALAVVMAATIAAGLVALASGPPGPGVFMAAGVMALAPAYVGFPMGAAAWVHGTVGPQALTWLIVVIAASDSAQYYTGRAFGRRKLAPVVSPKKTVEGAIGGLVVATGVGAALASWWLPEAGPAGGAVVAFVLAAFGIAGDLFESLLKRSAGVKDSSTLIPGHGGVLDRIDAYLFALPAFYVFLRYVR